MATLIKTARLLQQAPYIDSSKLDSNSDLLNLQNGTLDLSSNHPFSQDYFREARLEDYLTKVAGTEYRTDATAPNFIQYLQRITGGDSDLQAALQMYFGAQLGSHHCPRSRDIGLLYIPFAQPVFASAIKYVLGDYCLWGIPETSEMRGIKSVFGKISSDMRWKVWTPFFQSTDSLEDEYPDMSQLTFVADTIPPESLITVTPLWNSLVVLKLDEEKDPVEAKRLYAEFKEEAAGILNWLGDGHDLFLANDRTLDITDGMLADKNDLRLRLDTVDGFIKNCLEETGNDKDIIVVKEALEAFKDYAENCGIVGDKAALKDSLDRVFGTRGQITVEPYAGYIGWKGVKLRDKNESQAAQEARTDENDAEEADSAEAQEEMHRSGRGIQYPEEMKQKALAMKAEGKLPKEIAEVLGVASSTVYLWIKNSGNESVGEEAMLPPQAYNPASPAEGDNGSQLSGSDSSNSEIKTDSGSAA